MFATMRWQDWASFWLGAWLPPPPPPPRASPRATAGAPPPPPRAGGSGGGGRPPDGSRGPARHARRARRRFGVRAGRVPYGDEEEGQAPVVRRLPGDSGLHHWPGSGWRRESGEGDSLVGPPGRASGPRARRWGGVAAAGEGERVYVSRAQGGGALCRAQGVDLHRRRELDGESGERGGARGRPDTALGRGGGAAAVEARRRGERGSRPDRALRATAA